MPIMGFEVIQLPGREKREALIAGTERVWKQAWTKLWGASLKQR